MADIVKVATCNLNQWALAFDVNLDNIKKSIEIAKAKGCTFRTGPELEIPGYGCQDHFLEIDTFIHSWESLAHILKGDLTDGILVDLGMPVMHNSVRYNCRVFCLNRKIISIRPKIFMADDGNYREGRWFTSWMKTTLEQHTLPSAISKITGQRSVPFGVMILNLDDCTVTSETCEELFTPNSPHILLGLNGAEIIANGSGSHHQLRKLDQRLDLINSATAKGGGCYLYANQQGCDGDRLYYDGCAMISTNGKIIAQGKQFSVNDVEVVVGVVDLSDIRSYRAATASRGRQASTVPPVPVVEVKFRMTGCNEAPSCAIPATILKPQEEIAYGPACWMWDYLRRSGGGGYFLPLSGGADSSSTAALVGSMCQLVVKAIEEKDETVLADVRRVVRDSKFVPKTSKELANKIFHTTYMGTKNSSAETRDRAKKLAEEIGAYHLDITIDDVVSSLVKLFTTITGKTPKFKVHGGSNNENLALQNIQARLRMVISYLLAQLLPWVRGQEGFLLVLGSANVDEALRGYMTKYDCSSADLNPIGGICKGDLKSFLLWASKNLGYPSLESVVKAPPTAELEPITKNYKQNDEEDMGMTYEELGYFGKLRKVERCGPVTMFEKLRHLWSHLPVQTVADKVRRFFFYYSINRHKMTVITPSYHAENYSPDDNRFDLRQFLYNARWPRQFATIARRVKELVASEKKSKI
mmetsp:Transcript_755/g.1505  ORF Transcript_755/g.1505 Transcript_755/m.1505 type:complete len:698 (-) Transcript_755:116-2209(-)